MPTISDSTRGEFALIEKIRNLSAPVPEGVLGIGDDCAVLPQKDGLQSLVSCDLLVEGEHFVLDRISPRELGWKSAAVNISDIAAMGGRPRGTFLSLCLPEKFSEADVLEFIEGYNALSSRFSCPLLGGDTTRGKLLCINVTVLGECPAGRAVLRSGARSGDLICVTGPLGDSATGLELILSDRSSDPNYQYLKERHYLPVPRVGEGMAIAKAGAGAMMDISDGVASDLRHILKASAVGAEVDCGAIPMSTQMQKTCASLGLDPVEKALCGGEDYELLFTIGEQELKRLDVEHYVIGRITAGSTLVWKGSDRDYLGFRHF